MVEVVADSTAVAAALAALGALVARVDSTALADSAGQEALVVWEADYPLAPQRLVADPACLLGVSPDLVVPAGWARGCKALKVAVLASMDLAAELAPTSANLAITLPSLALVAGMDLAVLVAQAKVCVPRPTVPARVLMPTN